MTSRGATSKSMKCPYCGKRVKLSRSMLGGGLTEWHRPKVRGTPTIGKSGHCLGSGNVTPTKENQHAL